MCVKFDQNRITINMKKKKKKKKNENTTFAFLKLFSVYIYMGSHDIQNMLGEK